MMVTEDDYKSRIERYEMIRKAISKIRIGLPSSVEFKYDDGHSVVCDPRNRKWIVKPNGKPTIIHIITPESRIDVTKYKAGHLLKLAIAGYLRDDSSKQLES